MSLPTDVCSYTRWLQIWDKLGVSEADRTIELALCVRRCAGDNRRRADKTRPGEVYCTDCLAAVRVVEESAGASSSQVLDRVMALTAWKGKK